MRWRILVVGVLVVLAGCPSIANNGSQVETLTPAPVPDIPTVVSTPSGLAPGVTASGVRSVDALAAAHKQFIVGRSYVWHQGLTVRESKNESTGSPTTSKVLRVESQERFSYRADHITVHRNGGTQILINYRAFADGKHLYVSFLPLFGADRTYRRSLVIGSRTRFTKPAINAIRRYLDVQNATVSVVLVHDQRYYRIVSHRDSLPWLVNAENYTVTATLSPDGFVRSIRATYTVVIDEDRTYYTYSYEYEQLGNVTVERPEWVRQRYGDDTP